MPFHPPYLATVLGGRAGLPLTVHSIQESSPAPCLCSTVELTLMEWAQVNWPCGVRVGELALPLAGCRIGRTGWGSAGELALVVWVWESWWADQFRYHPGPGSGLCVGPPNIYGARACKGACIADPKLQDLHHTGWQQDIQEESW